MKRALIRPKKPRLPARRAAAVPLGVTQDQIARASDAIHGLLKVGNTDALVLARAALLAATRKTGSHRRERERQRRHDGEAARVAV